MAAIDIGCAAIDRGSSVGAQTTVNTGNPANASGKITSIEIWAANSMGACEIATFYVVSGNNLSTRDTEYIGDVTAGAKRTFNVDLNVQEGDYIGVYYVTGTIERELSGGDGYWGAAGDQIPCTDYLFSFGAGRVISLYGTGVTPEAGNAIFMGCNF